jgi:lipopolysaccharide export system protein LptA
MMWLPILTVKRLLSIGLSLTVSLWVSEGLAAEPTDTPILITAERMMVRNLEDRAVFEGKVHVKRDDFQMEADRMIVTFSQVANGVVRRGPSPIDSPQTKGPSPESRSISTIEANGHVRIVSGDRRATSQTAVYDGAEEKVVLTGNPESWEKDYKVNGTKMTFFLKENRSLTEGSSVIIQR